MDCSQYVDGDVIKPITSSDVNDYLHAITGGPFTSKAYRTWAATTGAAILFCGLDYPGDKRGYKCCVQRLLMAAAERPGYAPAVYRASYIHPRVIDGFISGAVGTLARPIRHRLPGDTAISADAIGVDALRAIEPLIARYLDGAGRCRCA